MKINGVIYKVLETETVGASGFRKRLLVIETQEQYPQKLAIEFVQDKVNLLDSYAEGQIVDVSINLRGREWINPEGEAKYFNSIQGWRIEVENGSTEAPKQTTPDPLGGEEPDDLPF